VCRKFYTSARKLRLSTLRKECGKGVRVALKDRLLLTADDLQGTLYEMRREEEENEKNKPPRKKRKTAAPPPPQSEPTNQLSDPFATLDSPSNSELE